MALMPRYYFNVRQGDSFVPDLEGLEFPDLATALANGAVGIKEALSEESLEGAIFEITDELGSVVLIVPCS
jgi:hypothetical protein